VHEVVQPDDVLLVSPPVEGLLAEVVSEGQEEPAAPGGCEFVDPDLVEVEESVQVELVEEESKHLLAHAQGEGGDVVVDVGQGGCDSFDLHQDEFDDGEDEEPGGCTQDDVWKSLPTVHV